MEHTRSFLKLHLLVDFKLAYFAFSRMRSADFSDRPKYTLIGVKYPIASYGALFSA